MADKIKWRVTVRGEGVELRGEVELDVPTLSAMATALKPYGMFIVSPAVDDGVPGCCADEVDVPYEEVAHGQAPV